MYDTDVRTGSMNQLLSFNVLPLYFIIRM